MKPTIEQLKEWLVGEGHYDYQAHNHLYNPLHNDNCRKALLALIDKHGDEEEKCKK